MENMMCIPTRDEIRAAYRQGGRAIIQLFDYLAYELQPLQDPLQAPFQRWVRKDTPHQKLGGCRATKRTAGRRDVLVTHWNSVEEPDHIELHKARFNVTK